MDGGLPVEARNEGNDGIAKEADGHPGTRLVS